MKITYPIFIEKGDENYAWGIIIPDLPGCFSASDEEPDIPKNAREAILLYLESEDKIPSPSLAEEISVPEGFYLSYIDVDIPE